MSESSTKNLRHGGSTDDSVTENEDAGNDALAFGRYRVVRHLASGGMGAVYLARDEVLQRDVAVKSIRPTPGRLGQEFSARFLNEARCVASLKHANIVPIFDLGLEGDAPYLVMEVVEGPSLGDVIKEHNGIRSREARILGIQIANALAEAHKSGIVHRDLKPGNILRADAQTWKLVDFGVAHVPDSSLTGIGDFLGTPSYAAPESLQGTGFSASSDVYGLAATLYHALGGTPPFGLGNAVKIALKAATEDAPSLATLNPTLPIDIVQIIDRCLSKNPSERPTAAEFAEQLAGGRAESYDDLPPGGRAESYDDLPPERSAIAFEPTAHFNTAELTADTPAPSQESYVNQTPAPSQESYVTQTPAPSPGSYVTHGPASASKAGTSRVWIAGAAVLVLAGGILALALGSDTETTPPQDKATLAAASPASLAPAERKAPRGDEPAAKHAGSESTKESADETGATVEEPASPSDASLPKLGSPEHYLEDLDEIKKLARGRASGQATRALDRLRAQYPDSAYLPYLQGSLYMDRRFWQDGFASYRSAIGKDARYREHPQVVQDAIRGLYSKSKPWMATRFIEDSLGPSARPALEKAQAAAANSQVKGRIASLLKKLDKS